MPSTRYLSRFILFLMGYMWITEHGNRDPRVRIARRIDNHLHLSVTALRRSLRRVLLLSHTHQARLIVSNHIAFIETLYYGWRAFPSFVAKSDVMKYPIVGTIGKGT